MKQVRGIWIPDCDPDSWIEKAPLVDGVPSYQHDQLMACVNACGDRLGVALDVGAHIGLWARHLSTHFQDVLAFEPIDMNFECLVRNAPGVCATRVAISDSCGRLTMGHVKVKSFAFQVKPLGNLPVTCVTVDSFGYDTVDLIKIDVEGHEYEVLRGGVDTIKRCRPVIMIEEKLDPEKRAIRFLNDLGMRCTWNLKFDYLFEW